MDLLLEKKRLIAEIETLDKEEDIESLLEVVERVKRFPRLTQKELIERALLSEEDIKAGRTVSISVLKEKYAVTQDAH